MKYIAIIVILLVIGAVGYSQYASLETPGAVSNVNFSAITNTFTENSSDVSGDMSEIQELLSTLGGVSLLSKLDTDFFKSPNYTILKDFSVPLFPAREIGKQNPFADVAGTTSQSPVVTPSQNLLFQNTTNTTNTTNTNNNTTLPSSSTSTDNTLNVSNPTLETSSEQNSVVTPTEQTYTDQDFLNSLFNANPNDPPVVDPNEQVGEP